MMPALKMLDMVMGVDVHIVQPPGPVPPLPIPHPFIGMLFDPMAMAPPPIGAKARINGMPNAAAGFNAKAVPPHIPIGGMFVKPPMSEGTLFMGSATVLMENSPAGFAALPVLTCTDIGMPAPPRTGKFGKTMSLMLPTSIATPIPAGPPVLIGGPPTIDMMGLLMQAAGSALAKQFQKLRKLSLSGKRMNALPKRVNNAAKKQMKKVKAPPKAKNKVHKSKCTVTGHPVDVATGKMFTDNVDFELPGPIPLRWERTWFSTSDYEGPLGHGWHHSYDMALWEEGPAVAVRLGDGRPLGFPKLSEGGSFRQRSEKQTLRRDKGGYYLEGPDKLRYRFSNTHFPDRGRVLKSVESPSGALIRFQYSPQGHLQVIHDSAGRQLQVRTDGKGRVQAIQAPHPDGDGQHVTLITYYYDVNGDMTMAVDPLMHSFRYKYADHLLVQETNRVGLNFFFEYDGKNSDAKCLRTWGDGGLYDHQLEYFEARGLTVVTNSLGHETHHYWNTEGLVYRTTNAKGADSYTLYNDFNEVEKKIDELGLVNSYEYDEDGNRTKTTAADGTSIEIKYQNDAPVKAKDAMGGEWVWEYDTEYRPIKKVDPLGRETEFQYQGPHLGAVKDPAGQVTLLAYDKQGNLSEMTTPDGHQSLWRYDNLGRCIAAVDAKGNTQVRKHDLAGNVVEVIEPDGNVRTLEYDGEGNVLRAKDQHYLVGFGYRGMNRLAFREQSGTRVEFLYDTEDQLIGIKNEHGLVYSFELDALGDVTVEKGFDGLRRQYERDAKGRVEKVLRPEERFSAYIYDMQDRVQMVVHSDGASERYGYREDGELVLAENDETSVEFERDPLGRILKETTGDDWVASEYDALGLRLKMQTSKGLTQEILRNAMGDVLSVKAWMGEKKEAPKAGAGAGGAPDGAAEKGTFKAEFTRDELGLELQRTLPGGVQAKWQRDKLGRPLRQEISVGGRVQRSRAYTWEANDRLKSIMDSLAGATHYAHDALGNLIAATSADGKVDLRMPDAVGNLFKTEDRSDRKYGPAGQLLEAKGPKGITRYEYDAEGNLIRKIEPSDKTWRYEWNSAGMLAKVVRPDGAEVTFGYDPLGRRLWKSFKEKTTRWVWDGNVPVHEWVEENEGYVAVSEESVQAEAGAQGGARQREAMVSGSSSQGPPLGARGTKDAPIAWLFDAESFAPSGKLVGEDAFSVVTDHLGTPIALYDDAGREAWSGSMEAWGHLRTLTGAAEVCPFRWPGQYEDAETGLYYNRFRYYDPEAGEYVSQDPIRLNGGVELCKYVRDPLTSIDPNGHNSCTPQDPRLSAAIASGRPVVIVGRKMSRVNPVRDSLKNSGANVKTYEPKNFRSRDNLNPKDVEANREWLRYWAKDKNALIVDIGADPLNPTDLGAFYGVESRSLYKNWAGNVEVIQFNPGF